jgi:hypothetical protein
MLANGTWTWERCSVSCGGRGRTSNIILSCFFSIGSSSVLIFENSTYCFFCCIKWTLHLK